MKSVLALLVVVALCNANIVKDGGLKGSWDDAFEITSVFDNTAPGVSYDGTSDFYYYYANPGDTPLNMSGDSSGYSYTQYISFAITGEDSTIFYNAYNSLGTAGIEVSLVDGDFEVESQYPCTLDSDLSVDCTFWIYTHSGQHSYTPVITTWDAQGNWATYSLANANLATSFTSADRPTTWMVYDHTPDFTAPVFISAEMNGAVADATVVLGTADSISTFVYVDLEVVINDHEDEEAEDYDEFASGVYGVWAVLVDADDEDSEEWTEALLYDTYDVTTEYENWAVRWAWAAWAPTGTWTILRFTAVDRAGNWATDHPFDNDIVVTFDNDDEVSSCQTLTITELTSTYDATATNGAYIYFSAGCVAKYTAGTNYGYISFASPEYIMDGDTLKSSVVVGQVGSYGYDATYMQTEIDIDWTASSVYPGTSFTGDTGFFSYINLRNGQASDEEGEWTLYELITFTASGAVQRYTFELGAASSVVPSAIAVVIAAVFAMLRL